MKLKSKTWKDECKRLQSIIDRLDFHIARLRHRLDKTGKADPEVAAIRAEIKKVNAEMGE